jgi:hypothetical protein
LSDFIGIRAVIILIIIIIINLSFNEKIQYRVTQNKYFTTMNIKVDIVDEFKYSPTRTNSGVIIFQSKFLLGIVERIQQARIVTPNNKGYLSQTKIILAQDKNLIVLKNFCAIYKQREVTRTMNKNQSSKK